MYDILLFTVLIGLMIGVVLFGVQAIWKKEAKKHLGNSTSLQQAIDK